MEIQRDNEILQLGYVRLGVNDLDWWRWFANLVGFDTVVDAPPGELQLRTDAEREYRFALVATGEPGVQVIGWEVATASDMEAVRKRLVAHNTPLMEVSRDEKDARKVEDMFAVRDPDGVRNEVYWGPSSALRKRFHSPVGTRFESGPCGNGHVTMNVSDASDTLKFYLGAMGLRLSDAAWMDGHSRVYFLRCNPRHHSFAFAEMPRHPVGTVHVMADLAGLDHLGVVRDRLLNAGVALNRDLGSHPLDGVVSIYVATPEGFDFELACGTRFINESTWETDKFKRDGLAWGHRKPTPTKDRS
ncbi:VOC family protein [Paraburkholderia unamae]|uniref:VOC family protein n=1 Tax=Paraburkholderia unamae TaxID=219649 RepID=A0ACC6RGF4_9BURK